MLPLQAACKREARLIARRWQRRKRPELRDPARRPRLRPKNAVIVPGLSPREIRAGCQQQKITGFEFNVAELATYPAPFAAQRNNGANRSFATLDPTLRQIQSESDGLVDRVRMTVAYRVPMGMTVAELRSAMEAWRGEAELRIMNEEEPFQAERNTALVRAFLQAIRDEGGSPRFALKHGTSDMNIVGPAWGCPIVAYGPGDSRLDHTPQEHISLAEFRRGIEVLKRVLQTI